MRKKLVYMVLDCETATLPFVGDIAHTEKQKQLIAINKPLIYDLGWTLMYRDGTIFKKKHFLISEVFSVPDVFNTAYYKAKRPLYMDMIRNNDIQVTTWQQATRELEKDLSIADYVGAFNAMFDFKKAIPFSELYINKLYSGGFYDWLEQQKGFCLRMLSNKPSRQDSSFDKDHFIFRNQSYDLFDVWGLACETLLNNRNYKAICLNKGMLSNSGDWFKTSAETAFKYLVSDYDFEEAHTALDDAIIESEILRQVLKRRKIEIGIQYFPFRALEHPIDFVLNGPKKHKSEWAKIVIAQMEEYLQGNNDYNSMNRYEKGIYNKIMKLMEVV